MIDAYKSYLNQQLDSIRSAGTYKRECDDSENCEV